MPQFLKNNQLQPLATAALVALPGLGMGFMALGPGLSRTWATVGIFGCLACLGAAAFLMKRIANSNPDYIIDFIAKVENGSLPSASSFPGYKTQTETETALIKMVSGIRNQRDIRDGQYQDVIEAMRKSGAVVGPMKQAGNLIAESSQTVSLGASNQAAAIEEISSSLTQLQGQTSTNAENAATASNLAEEARISGENGNCHMQEMISAMEEINDSSQQIAKIIQTIDEIAFQTNLLALNAAVEAARAGKYGKGFAVVAEEVRSLAGRSADAAREIADMIEESADKTERGMDIADRTGRALAEIVGSISKASALVSEISSASQEQALGIQEITTGMTQIEEITISNAAVAETNATSALKLSEQAGQLRNIIGRHALVEPGDGSPQVALIEWCDDYSVQVPEIDNQHKKLVHMINDLSSAIAMGHGKEVMQSIFDRLGSYVLEHFEYEEDLIRQAGYPDLDGHILIHEHVVAKFTALVQSYNNGSPSASSETLAFLQDWLINHIQKEDKKYTSCMLKSHNLVGV